MRCTVFKWRCGQFVQTALVDGSSEDRSLRYWHAYGMSRVGRVRYAVFSTLGLAALMVAVSACSAAKFSASDLFKQLDTQYVAADEPISSAAKARVIASHFKREGSEGSSCASDYDDLSVVEMDPVLLVLRTCQQSTIALRVYERTGGGYVGLVVSIMGNHGQGQLFRFFDVSKTGRVGREVTARALGITTVRCNDFLSPAQFFEQREDFPVPVSFDESDGSLEALPSTFGDPRWRTKEIVREIRFVWNGARFRKTITPER